MAQSPRLRTLLSAKLVHPHPRLVSAPLFAGSRSFFLAEDKIQVKYEMLRAHAVEQMSVVSAAATHGYSRAAFYLIAQAFQEKGMLGLLDEPRGRRGPLRLSDEILAFIQRASADISGLALAEEIEQRFGVHLHRRTVERARPR